MPVSVVPISSFEDERLDAYARLTEAQLRCRLEPERGIFIAESFKVIDRALEAGRVPVSFLVTPRWLDEATARAEAACASLGAAAGTDGTLPVFVADVDAVLVTPTCCDPLYRRAARVSMGTVFQVPWTRIGEDHTQWPSPGLSTLRDLGFTTAAFALTDESLRLDDPALQEVDRLAMVFGTEGDGLTRATIEGCDLTVRIPMAHGVDSLNGAAASAVAFWHLCGH